jgi:hypothetical protein
MSWPHCLLGVCVWGGEEVYLQSVMQTLYINCVYVAGCLNHRPGNDWTCNVSVSLQN